MLIVWLALVIFWVSLISMGIMVYKEPRAAAHNASLPDYRFGNYWFSVDYIHFFTTIRTHLKKVQKFFKRVVIINSHKVVEKLHRVSKKHVDILDKE